MTDKYPSFTTTITISPGDAEHCGECRGYVVEYGGSLKCRFYQEELSGDRDGYAASPSDSPVFAWLFRCLACLADEKKARERLPAGEDLTVSGRLLMECPECKGSGKLLDAKGRENTCWNCGPSRGRVEVPR